MLDQHIHTLRSNLNLLASNQLTDTIFQQANQIKALAKRH